MGRFIVRTLCAVAAALFLISCGSPAGAPTAPAEIPSPIVLKFVEPEQLDIDLSALTLASPSVSLAVLASGEFAAEISFGPYIQDMSLARLASILGGISALEIPVDESVTTFHEEAFNFGASVGNAYLRGVHDVKISFADFAFDGAGPVGCSGHTAELPVCARVWLDDVRYLAWVFDAYPFDDDPATPENEATPGAGRFKVYFPTSFTGTAPDLGRINYDFQNTDDLSLEFYVMAIFGDDTALGAHLLVTQKGEPNDALKRIGYNVAADLTPGAPPEPITRGNYLAQYREGYDFWSGSIEGEVETKGSKFLQNLVNQCAVISTGSGTDPANCADVGGIDISVGGIPFLAPVRLGDVELFDFPETPL